MIPGRALMLFVLSLAAPLARAADIDGSTADPPAPIANWKVVFFATTGLVEEVSGLDTDSPVFGDGTPNDMDGVAVAGFFGTPASPRPVTLAVGQTLTVSAGITFAGGVSDVSGQYRFAVLNDNGRFALGCPFDWGGGWNHTVGGTAAKGASIYQASTGPAAHFMSTLKTGDNNAVDINPTVSRSGTFNANSATPYLWTLSITRGSETTVDITSEFSGGPGNFKETYKRSNIPTRIFTYNAVGIQTANQTDLAKLIVSKAHFSVKP